MSNVFDEFGLERFLIGNFEQFDVKLESANTLSANGLDSNIIKPMVADGSIEILRKALNGKTQ